MSLILYKTLAGVLIFLASLVAVIYPLMRRAHPAHNPSLELGDALASGIFLGAALFHMLPNAIKEFSQFYGNTNYPLAELWCAGGFLLLLFFERLSGNATSSHHKQGTSGIPYVFAIIIIIHALIEGAALGINTTLAATSIIFLAIIAHKGSESFALAVVLNRSRLSLTHVIVLVTLFSLMTPLGIAFGTSISTLMQFKEGILLNAGFNAFAAGTFLYMSTLHHINHHQRSHEGEGLMEFFSLLGGLIIMAGLAWWA